MRIVLCIGCICLVLMGCSTTSVYKKDSNVVFEPREYYRSVISKEEVGVVLTKRESEAKQILLEIQQHPKIRDVIMLSHSGEMVIAIKPAAYYQKNMEEVKNGILQSLEKKGIAATLVTEPSHFRKVKTLKSKKYKIDLNEWEIEWNQVWGEI
jgi:hypothetical protein